MEYPLFVDDYVVIDIGMEEEDVPEIGEIILTNRLEYLSLAERRYFDFDK
jgi:hypothetical protein